MDWLIKHVPLLSVIGALVMALLFIGILYARFEALEFDMHQAYERLVRLEGRFNGIPARLERAERDISMLGGRIIEHVILPHVYRQVPPVRPVHPMHAPE